jgi:hypothetical protein
MYLLVDVVDWSIFSGDFLSFGIFVGLDGLGHPEMLSDV